MDDNLRIDLDELKQNIIKELPEAKVIGDEFPIKVVTENGTYSVDAKGKVERLTGISLDADKLTLQIIDGEKEEKPLNATLTDIEGEIIWSSSNESVATVDNSGNVKAVAEGTAVIAATCGEEKAECSVTVKNVISISSITLKINGVVVTPSTEIQELAKDSTLEITAETNSNATEDIIWESSNPSVAKVEGSGTRNLLGLVTGIKATAENEEITITAKSSKVAGVSVKVKVVGPIELSAADITSAMMSDDVVVNYVEYTRSNNTKSSEWQVLYADSNNIYLIMKYQTKDSSGYSNLNAGVNTQYTTGSDMLSDIGANTETQARFPAVNGGFFSKWIDSGLSSNNDDMEATLYMLDSNVWNSYIWGDELTKNNTKGKWAIGGPTLEMFAMSYDKINGYTDETNKTINKIGVKNIYGYKDGVWADDTVQKNTILNNEEDYWLACPVAESTVWGYDKLIYLNSNEEGTYNSQYNSSTGMGFRCVVALENEAKLVRNSKTEPYTVK